MSSGNHAAHSRLAHHFEDTEQQREAGTLGMWLFLVTEIMFFGGMFLAYTLFRTAPNTGDPDMPPGPLSGGRPIHLWEDRGG